MKRRDFLKWSLLSSSIPTLPVFGQSAAFQGIHQVSNTSAKIPCGFIDIQDKEYTDETVGSYCTKATIRLWSIGTNPNDIVSKLSLGQHHAIYGNPVPQNISEIGDDLDGIKSMDVAFLFVTSDALIHWYSLVEQISYRSEITYLIPMIDASTTWDGWQTLHSRIKQWQSTHHRIYSEIIFPTSSYYDMAYHTILQTTLMINHHSLIGVDYADIVETTRGAAMSRMQIIDIQSDASYDAIYAKLQRTLTQLDRASTGRCNTIITLYAPTTGQNLFSLVDHLQGSIKSLLANSGMVLGTFYWGYDDIPDPDSYRIAIQLLA